MKVVLFCHSILSCWNHGNAHFLRGVARELIRLGHQVTVYEPAQGWSRTHALRDGGHAVLSEAALLVSGLDIRTYPSSEFDAAEATDGADLVLVHEWNDPALVSALGRARVQGGRFVLFFHDTHHRAVTAPQELNRFDLSGYDGVLAFGEVLRDIYAKRGWGQRAYVWHEAADTHLFRPLSCRTREHDVIWIGNWGDDERTAELQSYLIAPIARLRLRARVHGVRYPAEARTWLERERIDYAGWLPNHRVPAAFARARATVHVPRLPYTRALPGIPTIRVFEALACGIPLISAPWSDAENLFPPGSFLTATSTDAMCRALSNVLRDSDLAQALRRTGLEAIASRHTCGHRVRELLQLHAITRRRAAHASTQSYSPQALAS